MPGLTRRPSSYFEQPLNIEGRVVARKNRPLAAVPTLPRSVGRRARTTTGLEPAPRRWVLPALLVLVLVLVRVLCILLLLLVTMLRRLRSYH